MIIQQCIQLKTHMVVVKLIYGIWQSVPTTKIIKNGLSLSTFYTLRMYMCTLGCKRIAIYCNYNMVLIVQLYLSSFNNESDVTTLSGTDNSLKNIQDHYFNLCIPISDFFCLHLVFIIIRTVHFETKPMKCTRKQFPIYFMKKSKPYISVPMTIK